MDSARKAQSLSTQQVGSLRFSKVFSLYRHVLVSVGWWQRVMAFGTQRATDQTMFEDNKSSSSALQRNINESESLKNRSEQQVGKTRLSYSLAPRHTCPSSRDHFPWHAGSSCYKQTNSRPLSLSVSCSRCILP